MPRYFLEVSYMGTGYAGFQVQENANTIQAEVTKALETYYKKAFSLTGSSRTDAGVHALQNFFHFDSVDAVAGSKADVYHLNAILPRDIVLKNIIAVHDTAHSRFDAISRHYEYHIYTEKNPFLSSVAFFYPYKLDVELLNAAAGILKSYSNFTSFSKRNTQAKTNICHLYDSDWTWRDEQLVYSVSADRFLRGMVRALVATMLRVGRGKLLIEDFESIIASKDSSKVDFSAPAHGLFLKEVKFPSVNFIDEVN